MARRGIGQVQDVFSNVDDEPLDVFPSIEAAIAAVAPTTPSRDPDEGTEPRSTGAAGAT